MMKFLFSFIFLFLNSSLISEDRCKEIESLKGLWENKKLHYYLLYWGNCQLEFISLLDPVFYPHFKESNSILKIKEYGEIELNYHIDDTRQYLVIVTINKNSANSLDVRFESFGTDYEKFEMNSFSVVKKNIDWNLVRKSNSLENYTHKVHNSFLENYTQKILRNLKPDKNLTNKLRKILNGVWRSYNFLDNDYGEEISFCNNKITIKVKNKKLIRKIFARLSGKGIVKDDYFYFSINKGTLTDNNFAYSLNEKNLQTQVLGYDPDGGIEFGKSVLIKVSKGCKN